MWCVLEVSASRASLSKMRCQVHLGAPAVRGATARPIGLWGEPSPSWGARARPKDLCAPHRGYPAFQDVRQHSPQGRARSGESAKGRVAAKRRTRVGDGVGSRQRRGGVRGKATPPSRRAASPALLGGHAVGSATPATGACSWGQLTTQISTQ
jgi:hypothetical protein